MARDFLRQLPKGNNARTFSLLSWLYLDPWLFFLLLVLSCAGLTVLHSASDGDWLMLKRQMIFMGFGYLMMMVVARIPQMLVKQVSPFLYLFSIALLVLVMFFGTGAKGAQRWLDLPLLARVGLAAAPADARPEVREACAFVSQARGGRGAVRELAEYILGGKGLLAGLLDDYRQGRGEAASARKNKQ